MVDTKSQHRDLLIATEQKAQEQYDKTVIVLSGGALAITLSLFKEVSVFEGFVDHHNWLFFAWIMWTCSVAATLFSHFFGVLALRYSIKQVDIGDTKKRRGALRDNYRHIECCRRHSFFSRNCFNILFFIQPNGRRSCSCDKESKRKSRLFD